MLMGAQSISPKRSAQGDSFGKVIDVNPCASQLLHRSAESIVGKPLGSLFAGPYA
jgi:hypothetical protein